MLEVVRAQKTIFIARYLRDGDLQREIEEGLNLIEAWNRVNTVIFYFLRSSGRTSDPTAKSGST
jgi:TnpA family transposase